MKEKLSDIKSLLSPTDGLAFLAIIVGLCIAIFLPDTPIKVIGGSVATLGLLAVVISLNQKLKDYEVLKKRRGPQVSQQTIFTTTIKKDTTSKRLIFEDYGTSFGSENNFDSDEPIDKNETNKEEEKKETTIETPILVEETKSKIEVEEKKETIEVANETVLPETPHFNEIKKVANKESGFRIIEKKKPEPIVETKKEEEPVAPKVETKEVKQETLFEPTKPIEPKIETKIPKIEHTAAPEKPKEEVKQTRKTQLDVNIADFIADIPSQGFEPRKEFDYLLNRALMVIRSAMSARTVCYFWVNQEKGELVLESHLTDLPQIFVKNRAKFPLAYDIISQIARNGKPEILTEINPSAELDLIPYYLGAAKTSSFIGVPVFYNGSVIGVLCSDTELYDAYDAVTVGFLGQFTKLIGGLTHSYIEKYDLYQASRTLEAVETLRVLISAETDNQSIANAIVESASRVVEYYSIGVALYDETQNKWLIQALKSNHPNLEQLINTPVSLNNSLVGRTIATGEPVYICPLSENEVKYSNNEPKIQGGYFISAPLKTSSNNYGALFIEGISPTSVMQNDLDILSALGEHAGATIERFLYLSMLRNSALYYDENYGVLNQKAFVTRLSEELARAKDYNTAMTLCLFKIDHYQSFGENDIASIRPNVNEHILNNIRKYLKEEYHLVGNISSDLFAVGLIGANAQKAHLWAEQIRSKIAITPLKIGSKQYTVTVSIGIAECSQGDDLNGIFEKSGKALETAIAKTNSVYVFS